MSSGAASGASPVAFYCVCDSRYFLGAVAMVNSLRAHGHAEPVHLLDLGLESWQRDLLTGEASVADPPADPPPPWLAKTILPLARPAGTMVLIDADMIVTRPLGDLIAAAAAGAAAFENVDDRWEPRWGELLGLGALERRTYVCSGLIGFGGAGGPGLLRRLDEGQRRVDVGRGYFGADDPSYPFRFPEQDVLNAVIAAAPPESSRVLPLRLAPMPPFPGLEPVPGDALAAEYADGERPFVVHHYLVKPWLEPTREGVYSELLRRALSGPRAAIEVPSAAVPRRFRGGVRGRVAMWSAELGVRLRERLPRPRPKLRRSK